MKSFLRHARKVHVNANRTLSVLAVAAAAMLAAPVAHADPLKGAPAPFDKGGVKIALVNYLSTGDFFQAYEAGAQKQAKALGVDLRIYEGRQDAAEQREQIQQAISLGVSAIIVNHGLPESLKDVVQRALDKGIKVVAFDVDLGNPKVPQIEQSDHDLATLLLNQAVKDNGDTFDVGYVYVAGFAPLDRRDAVWREFKAAHPNVQEKARWGTVDNPIAQSVANQAAAAYRAHPEIRVVFAPSSQPTRRTCRRNCAFTAPTSRPPTSKQSAPRTAHGSRRRRRIRPWSVRCPCVLLHCCWQDRSPSITLS
jgi:simple sugar transport system substrate-binding protein